MYALPETIKSTFVHDNNVLRHCISYVAVQFLSLVVFSIFFVFSYDNAYLLLCDYCNEGPKTNLSNRITVLKVTIPSRKVSNGPINSSRLLPNGCPGTRVTYNLPSGNQNFKKGARTGAKNL